MVFVWGHSKSTSYMIGDGGSQKIYKKSHRWEGVQRKKRIIGAYEIAVLSSKTLLTFSNSINMMSHA